MTRRGASRSLFESEVIREEIARVEEQGKAKIRQLKDLAATGEQLAEVLSRGFLPLYTLHLLSEAPRHGNDLLKEIETRTEGLWAPSSGGMYALLKKLEKKAWITGEWEEGETRAKRTYSLTPLGEDVLTALLEIVPPRVAAAHRALELVARDLMGNPRATKDTRT
jgi:DNA-binding PadR family transcriptional regulator